MVSQNKQESAPSYPIYRLEPPSSPGKNRRRKRAGDESIDWFRDLTNAIQFGRWNDLRGRLSLLVSQQDTQVVVKNDEEVQKQQKGSFWKRIATSVGVAGEEEAASSGQSKLQQMKSALLQQEKESGRTPLHLCLHYGAVGKGVPTDISLFLIRLEPRAARIPDSAGNFPLHTAVLNLLHLDIIAALVEAHPAGIAEIDARDQSPLFYAVERAKGETDLSVAPKTFWMTQKEIKEDQRQTEDEHTQAVQWQEEQVDRWAVVHWLLLASATHPQTSLSVGGKKPMLVDSLVFAAPPAVVSLLIGASVVLLTYEKRATAFAGTTIYTCISRHYPLTILLSLCLQCPRDVRLVQDETGMGLVAAQFVTGFFRKLNAETEEWKLFTAYVEMANHVLTTGTLPSESEQPGFFDWWKKMEFLIAFGTGQKLQSDKKYPTKYLLHAALANSDVTPLAVRFLLALYPDSVELETPAPHELEGSLPIHLAAVTQDYIPRYYEWQIVGSSLLPSPGHDDGNDQNSSGLHRTHQSHLSSLDVVVKANPEAVLIRYKRRLPLHMAIDAGKLYSSLKPLIDSAPETLLCRDPETFLYPWLHVAAAGTDLDQVTAGVLGPDGKYKSHSRWAYFARNKYTNNVWRGLSDRQRGNAVVKQYNTLEVLERSSTIYRLLRRAPAVMDHLNQIGSLESYGSKKKGPIRMARDETGMGTVAQHYLNYVYPKTETGKGRILSEDNKRTFQKAIQLAPTGDWISLPPDFERWFNKLKFWIKYCCPSSSQLSSVGDNSIPANNDRFALHMAVMNPDTPPDVIRLLLAVSRPSASMVIPHTSILPLHLAAETSPYVPRSYEEPCASTVSLLINAYPDSVVQPNDAGRLPLHLAIAAGRVDWEDSLSYFVGKDNGVLKWRDPVSDLYPFQQVAIKREFSKEDRMRFQYLGRNKSDESTWNTMSPREQTRAVYDQYQEFELSQLTSIFELLRRDTSIFDPPPPSKSDSAKNLATASSKVDPLEDEDSEAEGVETSYHPDDHEEDITESTHGQDYLKDTPISLDMVLAPRSPVDQTESEASNTLTEADTIVSVPLLSPAKDLSWSSRSRSNGIYRQPIPPGTASSNRYIPDLFQGSSFDDSTSDRTSNNEGDEFAGDTSYSASHNSGLPDLDPSENGSELLELESHTSNRSHTSNHSGSARSTPSRSTRSMGSVSTASEGSRVQEGPEQPSSLMRLLSQNTMEDSQPTEDVYESDASMLSNLDVMSTLSTTLHSTMHNETSHGASRHNPRSVSSGGFYGSGTPTMLSSGHSYGPYDDDDASFSMTGSSMMSETETEGEGESSGMEFGGESLEGEESFTFAGDDSTTILSLPKPAEFLKGAGSDYESEDSDDDSVVYFQFRRRPRTAYWEDEEMVDNPVRLAGRRRSGEHTNMDSSTTHSPALQLLTNTTHKSDESAGKRMASRNSMRASQVSLKSHLSEMTSSFGDTRHTFKSFATDGSAVTFGEKSHGSGDRSYASTADKSFATSGDSYVGDRSYASLSPGGFKKKASMRWISDQIKTPLSLEAKTAASNCEPTPRATNKRYQEDGGTSSGHESMSNSGQDSFSNSAPSLESDSSTPVSVSAESFESLQSPFNDLKGNKGIGMVWLDDPETGKEKGNERRSSNFLESLLASQTSFDESKDDLLFHDESSTKSNQSSTSENSKSDSPVKRALLTGSESESDDSSVMEFASSGIAPLGSQSAPERENDEAVHAGTHTSAKAVLLSNNSKDPNISASNETSKGSQENGSRDEENLRTRKNINTSIHDDVQKADIASDSRNILVENQEAPIDTQTAPAKNNIIPNSSGRLGSPSAGEDDLVGTVDEVGFSAIDQEIGRLVDEASGYGSEDSSDTSSSRQERRFDLKETHAETSRDSEKLRRYVGEQEVLSDAPEAKEISPKIFHGIQPEPAHPEEAREQIGNTTDSEKSHVSDVVELPESVNERSRDPYEWAYSVWARKGLLKDTRGLPMDNTAKSKGESTSTILCEPTKKEEAPPPNQDTELVSASKSPETSSEFSNVNVKGLASAFQRDKSSRNSPQHEERSQNISKYAKVKESSQKEENQKIQNSTLESHLASDKHRENDSNPLASQISQYMPEGTMAPPRLDPIEEEMSMTSSQFSLSSLHSKPNDLAASTHSKDSFATEDRAGVEDSAVVFDRKAMKWVKKANSTNASDTVPATSGTSSVASEKRLVFDRTTFRWLEVNEDEAHKYVSGKPRFSSNAVVVHDGKKKSKRRKKTSVTINLGRSALLRKPMAPIPEQSSRKVKRASPKAYV